MLRRVYIVLTVGVLASIVVGAAVVLRKLVRVKNYKNVGRASTTVGAIEAVAHVPICEKFSYRDELEQTKIH
ncbi:unnamed protein product [Angiostrongylus costaricensis]|uniref:Col_cuticle_N domain-containing protein n=1 Tax=Angiostrongylus costaricensis TaxID=334426 RepID=A0A0R3PXY0_ANGCS|nr:unnamed protein product [Angiostrongylus costaricensis]